jgi:hypothetical protein
MTWEALWAWLNVHGRSPNIIHKIRRWTGVGRLEATILYSLHKNKAIRSFKVYFDRYVTNKRLIGKSMLIRKL